MFDPSPFSTLYFRCYGYLIGKVPDIHVADVIKSEYFAYASEAHIDVHLQFLINCVLY